jgi:6-phosphofructokinase 2
MVCPMSDILTITLNPAYDVSTSVGTVAPGPKLRCEPPRYDPGGGGVNVSRAFPGSAACPPPLSRSAARPARCFMRCLMPRISRWRSSRSMATPASRSPIIETSTRRQYRFQLPGPDWRPEQTAAMLEHLRPHLTRGRIVVMSGSLPPGVPADIASTINRIAVECGSRLILDTSGAALSKRRPIPPSPFALLRMDGAEATEVSGRTFASPAELADYGLNWSRQAWLSSW